MGNDHFQIALDALSDNERHLSKLAHPFRSLLPVTGVSISTFGDLLGAETVSATDALAVRVDELQFDLGEGPCWDALALRQPVLEPNFATRTRLAWPTFSDALVSENIGAIFAFPLVLGPLQIGAVDLYSLDPVALSAEQQHQTLVMSAIVSRVILGNALSVVDSLNDTSKFSRRLIHQATGMVLVQLNISPEDAYLVIRARAFAENRPMQEVALDVVERRIRFTGDNDRIEDSP